MATRRTTSTATKQQSDTVERRILFYRLDAGFDESGGPKEVPVADVLAALDELEFSDEGRYLTEEDGNSICAWIDKPGRRGLRLQLGRIRRSGFPSVEVKGKRSPVPVPAQGGLAESFHAVFFPDGIVGVEFNFYAPRASRIGDYFWRKARPISPRFALLPLLRQDVREQLQKLAAISMMRLRIKASFVEQVRKADDSLGAAFEAARVVSGAEDIELVLRPRLRSKETLQKGLKAKILRLVGLNNLNESTQSFVVAGPSSETMKREEIDVLSDSLVALKRVKKVTVKGREVDSESAYLAIEEAYDDLHDQLVEAAALAQ